jgi:hypothetical protein
VSRLKAAEIVEEPSSLVVWKFGTAPSPIVIGDGRSPNDWMTAQRQDHGWPQPSA